MCHIKLHWCYFPLPQRFDFQFETRLLGIAALLSRRVLVQPQYAISITAQDRLHVLRTLHVPFWGIGRYKLDYHTLKNLLFSIEHINEYLTMQYFGIPRHTQSMTAYKVLTEYFLKIPLKNCIVGMLSTCPMII